MKRYVFEESLIYMIDLFSKSMLSRHKYTVQCFVKELAADDPITSIPSLKIVPVKVFFELDI